MNKALLLIALLGTSIGGISQTYTSYFTGNTSDLITSPTGGMCLMGGATEEDEAMKWFLERAEGGDVLVLRTSGSDGYNDYMYSGLGVTINSVETIVFNSPSAANDPYIQQRIMEAEAIWFAGGDQWNYVSYWRNTPIDSLMNDGLRNRNIVIGGTSAGMAIMGSSYFSAENGTVTSSTAMANPYNTLVTVDDTPFLQNEYMTNVITDTHYDDPDRKGRHMVFLVRMSQGTGVIAKGIACDEYTAVCVDENGIARVFGGHPTYDDNAYFLQVNCAVFGAGAEQCQPGMPLTWNLGGEAAKVYQVKGNQTGSKTFDLNDWSTGTGGVWRHWYVDNGVLFETSGSSPTCLVSQDEIEWSGFVVYPNPGSREITIEFETPGTRQIEIVSMDGRVLIGAESANLNWSRSTENLADGSYLVRVIEKSSVKIATWIKE
jgi:cyanophycinase-like exopeptidase